VVVHRTAVMSRGQADGARRRLIADRRRCDDIGTSRSPPDARCPEHERPPAVRRDLLHGAEKDNAEDDGGPSEHHPASAVLPRDRLRSNLDRVGSRPADRRETHRMRCRRHQSTGRWRYACAPLTARL
jgi:hypothetical protein